MEKSIKSNTKSPDQDRLATSASDSARGDEVCNSTSLKVTDVRVDAY